MIHKHDITIFIVTVADTMVQSVPRLRGFNSFTESNNSTLARVVVYV